MPGDATLPAHVRHFIIGAGFGGIGMAIKLEESGEPDFLVVDKGSSVGGTWRDNTYPGATCDIPSQLYSFSFALNPDWSRSYSPQPEIWAYLQRVAEEAGVLDRFVFDTSVDELRWDDDAMVWRIATSAGSLSADIVISAAGGLSEPRMPDIDGLGDFAGPVFHSARWDHSVDLTGRRVAVIGTGASAIQIVPQVAKVAAHVDVYQRTAPWVLPRNNRAYSGAERWAFHRLPGMQSLYRLGVYLSTESRVPIFTRFPQIADILSRSASAHMRRTVLDPELREKLTPHYTMGCKRILISDDYYPALVQPHVDLVTDGIVKVTPHAVVTADGTERDIDVLIVATGFHATDQPIAGRIYGREGVLLSDLWEREGMSAHRGTTVHGYPNLFLLVGPNTGLGHSSMVFVIESQIAYVMAALRAMRRDTIGAAEVTERAQIAWNAQLQHDMERTVWTTGGCSSWYLDRHGRNVTLWPYSTLHLRRLLAHFDAGSYSARRSAGAVAT